jgi:antitoxin (DNA-binding transcriptional repressor) of toxin-antitoxin stability system
MTTVNIHELSPITADALKRALAGEEVFITDDKETRLAQIVSIRKETNPLSDKPIRKGGFAKGKIHLSEDWDSKETNDEIAREFGMLD